MNLFFEFFFEVFVAAGPFYIFKGMGTGKDSGKILFRTLKSSDSSVTITEDESGLTFSSSGGPVAIDDKEIVFGTGTGITSSNVFFIIDVKQRNLKVDTRPGYQAIVGAKRWSPYFKEFSSSAQCENNLIVGGLENYIVQNGCQCSNLILAGFKNKIKGSVVSSEVTYGRNNVIVSGYKNYICNADNSSIIGGKQNSFACKSTLGIPGNGPLPGFDYTKNSTILASSDVCLLRGSFQSIVMSSCINDYISDEERRIYDFYRTSVISSSKFSNFKGGVRTKNSSFISTCCSNISGNYNSVLSGRGTITGTASSNYLNTIASTGNTSLDLVCRSTVISGSGNVIGMKSGVVRNSNNMILSGKNNRFDVNTFVELGLYHLKNSAIISGYYNCIYVEDLQINSRRKVCNSTIVSGYRNCIFNSENSFIMSSICSKILLECNSLIMSGYCNLIGGTASSKSNAIVSGGFNTICKSSNSVFISTGNTYQSCGINNVVISSTGSTIKNTAFPGNKVNTISNNIILSSDRVCIASSDTDGGGFNNSIISQSRGRIFFSYNSGIIGGCCSEIYCSNNSIIIGGKCNESVHNRSVDLTNASRFMIGGYKNKLEWKPNYVGIIGGQNNCICDNVPGAAIIGGCNIVNNFQYKTMVPILEVCGKTWMCGFTGSSGTWTSGGPAIRVCKGLIVCIT